MNLNALPMKASPSDALEGSDDPSGDVQTPFSLLEHLPIGLLVVDPAANVVFVNEYV